MECGTPSTQNCLKNRQFQESIEDVFIQVELIVEDVCLGLCFISELLCLSSTKLGHMLINHCFPFVCVLSL